MPNQQGPNISYVLLTYYGSTYVDSDLVAFCHLLPFTTQKVFKRFCMSPRIQNNLLATIKNKQSS
jgi:hypothetical protein